MGGGVVARHRQAGRFFDVAGLRSFVLDEGDGEAVVLMHGVPASCYLYRKVVPALAERGLRGVAFDLPGLGLADRPTDFDYTWTGLGVFAAQAVDSLDLDRFHLVVHDIGGPVGLEVAAALPGRVASLTLLNTVIDVAGFTKPWPMRPFEVPVVNRAWLESLRVRPMFRRLMRYVGVADPAIPDEDLDAYVDLLLAGDGGRAFLSMMTSFETTTAKSALYTHVVSSGEHPRQVVWGVADPALRFDPYGRIAERLTGTSALRIPGKHFLQEDHPQQVADAVARLAGG